MRLRAELCPRSCCPIPLCQLTAITEQLSNRGTLRGYGPILLHHQQRQQSIGDEKEEDKQRKQAVLRFARHICRLGVIY